MSELINNREVHIDNSSSRKVLLKQILKDLHQDINVDEVKKRYEGKISGIRISELAQTEHELMDEHGIAPEQVRRVCSNHTEFFKEVFGLADDEGAPQFQIGHPVHTFFLENKSIDEFIQSEVKPQLNKFEIDPNTENVLKLEHSLGKLYAIDKHYDRKENLLFPYLEKYGIYGPSTMMWQLDDEIRASIKDLRNKIKEDNWNQENVLTTFQSIIVEITQMIFREENILLPMAIEKLTEDDWIKIQQEEHEIGYTFIDPPLKWKPEREDLLKDHLVNDGVIQLETGILQVEQLELMMNHLPVDITFIDENDVVRYFSHGKKRIFNRTKSVIGRTVQHCHPPHSVHIVEQLLEEFKSGKKDVEDFWIQFKDQYVLIRYFAVRDKQGNYKGTLEFTQDIKPIQAITGEKRLM